jgi:L-alanine-DL-glutamate epimerase-like enolase superfamily enzyme
MVRQHFWHGHGIERATAIAGIDIALWDILGKVAGMPCSKLWGGPVRDHVRTYCHLGGGNMEDFYETGRFHGLILTAARNPWLAKAASDVSLLSITFSPERFEPSWLDVKSMVASWRDHRRLARLVRLRRGADAADLMRRHLAAGRKSIEQFLIGRMSPLQTGTLLPVGDGDENPQPLARRRGRPPKATAAKRPAGKQSGKQSAVRTRP